MPCSHNCDHDQSAVNGQNGFLAAGQRSKYPKTVALIVKISLFPRPLSSSLWVTHQHNQRCIVAVPVNEATFDR